MKNNKQYKENASTNKNKNILLTTNVAQAVLFIHLQFIMKKPNFDIGKVSRFIHTAQKIHPQE